MDYTNEKQSIHDVILERLGEGPYNSYFINTPIRFSGQYIDFVFTKPFTKKHAEKQYQEKSQEAIRSLYLHKNKEVRFILEKEYSDPVKTSYGGYGRKFKNLGKGYQNYVAHELKKDKPS